MSENGKDKDLQEKIGALIQFGGEGSDNEDLIREIIITALRLSQNHVMRGDLKIIHAAVKEMRYAFKLFAPYKEIRKVSVFGS
ncbi:MAG TPA: hypothetical protein VI382_06355, partial [Candidatus Manganitrophaceae bacterium]|nr:hypothetical protein [Candidatus Manganitrophaceae bacterium]